MPNSKNFNTAIIGASGYVGAELLRYLAMHPEFHVGYVGAHTSAGKLVADIYPSLAGSYPDLMFQPIPTSHSGTPESHTEMANHAKMPRDLDVAFLCLPHGESSQYIDQIWDSANYIVDLAADFRLPIHQYEAVYSSTHGSPDKYPEFVVGIPEFFAEELLTAKATAVPGCYTTAATLGLKPLVESGLIAKENIIVDAASGVSGAGKTLSETAAFCNDDENFFAYKLEGHRHTPEMEKLLTTQTASVLFVPHLAPMNRGILATCYAKPAHAYLENMSDEKLLQCYLEAYESAPFVHVIKDSATPPATKNTLGSNSAHVHALYNEPTDTVIALSAIDNLGKGAAGQGIQCANLMCGIAEDSGLSVAGLYP